MSPPPFVRRGQTITAALWNQLAAAARACRLIAGPGVRLRETPDGTIICAERGAAAWNHPFRVSLVGSTKALILTGRINMVEPEIKGVPLRGEEGEAPPLLEWNRPKLDPEGRGYIALEMQFGEKWELTKGKVKVVQVAYFDSEDGTEPPEGSGGPSAIGGIPGLTRRRARYPLAELRERSNGRLDLFQIVHFNIAHRAQPKNTESDIARHFYWAAAS